MSKIYSLVLNSSDPRNRTITNGIGAYSYYVNWGAFLPKDVKLFKVSFSFRSVASVTDPLISIIVNAAFGSTYCYDQSSSVSNYLGTVSLKSYQTDTNPIYYYEASENDNCSIMANYPSNNFVVVQLADFENVQISPDTLENYVLQINFESIE